MPVIRDRSFILRMGGSGGIRAGSPENLTVSRGGSEKIVHRFGEVQRLRMGIL